ncbi:hypothetical protein GCM10022280_08460 [Sphingomonas swuensis]|uniref:Lipoprotein n=1 Tax=Sphingomonas swuensis TaxID=977800 RepID=A0ABP7SJY2_9SPHN
MRKASMAVVLACGIAGCATPEANVYDLPIAEASKRLLAADLTEFKYQRQCGVLLAITPGGGGNAVTWWVSTDGMDVFYFTARLTEVGPGKTKVDVEVSKDSNGKESYSGTTELVRPLFLQPLRPAITELVDATLEQRKHDYSFLNKTDVKENNGVCNVQRGSMESGFRFRRGQKGGEYER